MTAIEVVERQLLERGERAGDPGVEVMQVDAAEALDRALDRRSTSSSRPTSAAIASAGPGSDAATASAASPVAVDDDDRAPPSDRRRAVAAPIPLAGSGDQGHLIANAHASSTHSTW